MEQLYILILPITEQERDGRKPSAAAAALKAQASCMNIITVLQ